MGRTICTEPQCLYKGALLPFLLYLVKSTNQPIILNPACRGMTVCVCVCVSKSKHLNTHAGTTYYVAMTDDTLLLVSVVLA
jgi:hypothetical protein